MSAIEKEEIMVIVIVNVEKKWMRCIAGSR